MITQYHVLRQQLVTEWANGRPAAQKAQAAFVEGGAYHVDAASLSLHGFYSGTEWLLEWIARQIDASLQIPSISTGDDRVYYSNS
jgi:hypothetical protein